MNFIEKSVDFIYTYTRIMVPNQPCKPQSGEISRFGMAQFWFSDNINKAGEKGAKISGVSDFCPILMQKLCETHAKWVSVGKSDPKTTQMFKLQSLNHLTCDVL